MGGLAAAEGRVALRQAALNPFQALSGPHPPHVAPDGSSF